MKLSGAKIIIECLKEQGVDTVFGYPGGTILPLYDALKDSSIKHILTVHEQGAAHAADGYARASGRVGVCISTSGPGATNLITGLAAAFMDSVPVVAITGQVPTTLIGRDAFQEIDITGMTMAITKHNFLVKDPAKLADTIRAAFDIAKGGRPGPVLIDIPRDIQGKELFFKKEPPLKRAAPAVSSKLLDAIKEAAETIAGAARPIIISGGGTVAAGAHEEIKLIADKMNIPVASTLMGLGSFSAYNPQFIGLTGMHGLFAANNAVGDADVIIAAGSRFSDRVTSDRSRYSSGKKLIHIDIDPAEIDKNVDAYIGLAGDLKIILGLIAGFLTDGADLSNWWDKIKLWQKEAANDSSRTAELAAPWIYEYLSEKTKGKPFIFAADVGQHQMWAAQHLKVETPRTWLTSGGLGSMGFALPAALGAQVALPEKRVISLSGDGGFKMTGSELYTISQYNLPVIAIIINNNGLGMIRQLQTVFFNKNYFASELAPLIDFKLYAASFGINANVADNRRQFEEAFTLALASKRPEIIVANISPEDMVSPMIAPDGTINSYLDI